MKRSEKDAIIDEVAERISAAQALYFADFSGVTVAEESELRREFRKAGVGYTVAKNTLIRKALERVTGYDKVYDTLVGPTGIAFCGDDVAAPAKIIKKFFDKTGKFRLKAAVLEKQVYDGSKIATLAQIPSRKELIAGILGTLQSPASGIVGAINALARDLVSIVGQIADKKKAA
ncbi:MAG: 50S ribosomal protein L10 [Ignavibacteria bacterium GWA2_55_11]|nr:MAG: 50S ribosomal protein L10 [Ignavibacteria bacterium GWA2_55_11]OGU43471.1 MAG: 50S ribosomal protein L10 [Ignavibacteria bacterium GWC2_56_12]OGU65001.1 MAG: 50S ribosomal protein L10 [Ignavibacteria bacterium RIFCSPHIGHO2_02_FULL_56_12]OGU71885.1 MAG: 50S ribosomal protein L10 [Ignavibacteria bacterium RIFCSPLOWO2_12_FULL_56_21]OGU74652.1 MAG: 50S ribosomal protein L10 [Ignavibacteria bacterium RIFCSPLOWO2_02_FULL_55_14]